MDSAIHYLKVGTYACLRGVWEPQADIIRALRYQILGVDGGLTGNCKEYTALTGVDNPSFCA